MQRISEHGWILYCLNLQAKLEGIADYMLWVMDIDDVELFDDINLLKGMMGRMATIGWSK